MKHVFLIFGGNGDLSKKKLLPSLYQLFKENKYEFKILILDIVSKEKNEYYNDILDFLDGTIEFDAFTKIIDYYQIDLLNNDSYFNLNKYLFSNYNDFNRIYYLSISPNLYIPIVLGFKNAKMNTINTKIAFEKPFGSDYESSLKLNNIIKDVFYDEQVYCVDHYLARDISKWLINSKYESKTSPVNKIINNNFIKEIRIMALENIGIDQRGKFYDNMGAIKDMVQSHLLQLLALILVRNANNYQDLRLKKISILKSLRKFNNDEIDKYVIRGQYQGYLNEQDVSKTSTTDSFIGMRVFIEDDNFKDIPIYIVTGKRLKRKKTEIIFTLESKKDSLISKLYFCLFPNEEVYFENKEKDTIIRITSPNKPYRNVFEAIINNDKSLFISHEEIEAAWKFIDVITKYWQNSKQIIPIYECNSYGPEEFKMLLNLDEE